MRRCCLVIAILCLAVSCFGSQSDSEPASKIDTALGWLPTDTETVVVANLDAVRSAPSGDGPRLGKLMWQLPAIGLPQALAGAKITSGTIMDATRHYTSPNGLGLWHFEGCKILWLNPTEATPMQALARRKEVRQTTLEGLPVAVIEEGNKDDLWTYYLAFDGPLMFCATNKQFLDQVLARRSHPQTDRALPTSLPIWSFVDRNAPIWAVREVSPESKRLMGGTTPEAALDGYAITLNTQQTSVTVVAVSDTDKGAQAAEMLWTHWFTQEQGTPPLEDTRPNPKTMRLVLNGTDDRGDRAMFIIMAALGHYINL